MEIFIFVTKYHRRGQMVFFLDKEAAGDIVFSAAFPYSIFETPLRIFVPYLNAEDVENVTNVIKVHPLNSGGTLWIPLFQSRIEGG